MAVGNASTGTASNSGPMDLEASFSAAMGEGGDEGSDSSPDTADGDGGGDTEDGDGGDSDEQSAAHREEEQQADEASAGDESESGDGSEDGEGGKEGQTAKSGDEPFDATTGDLDRPKLKALLDSLPSDEARKIARDYINSSIQPKFQAIASARNFLEEFRKDPVAAAYRVLREKGVEVPETTTPKGKTTGATTAASAGEAPSEIATALSKVGFTKEQVAAVESIFKPVVEAQNAAKLEKIAAHMEGEVSAFKKTHPEFDRLEPIISTLMDEMPAGPTANLQTYLDRLYQLALGSEGNKTAVSKSVKATLKKITENAASASPKTRGIPSSTVQPGKSGPLDIKESFELAMRGETRGRGIKTRA